MEGGFVGGDVTDLSVGRQGGGARGTESGVFDDFAQHFVSLVSGISEFCFGF